MSLFKAREWWSATSGYEEFHDLGCLCIGNLDNSIPAANKIAVGSFQGIVRVYRPEMGSFSPHHLLVEHQTGLPVLQLEAGKFLQSSKQVHLAVLHPREVAVYSLSSPSTDDPSGLDQSVSEPSSAHQYQLTLVYKNSLSRTACNMVIGSFGRAEAGDYICVQSLDGQLSFFVHESFAFATFLPDFLTPGPLCYLPRTDCIITANSSRQLQCFQYQALSMAYCGSADVASRENAGKIPVAEWAVNLGDHVISIRRIPQQSPGRRGQVLVLGERGVYCCMDSGQLRFMMKLEINPSCCIFPYGTTSYHSDEVGGERRREEGECSIQYLLATDSGQLQVFQDSTLKWAASLPHTPTDISVASFQDLQGLVVTVDELGHLTCSYLGTDPSTFSAPPLSSSSGGPVTCAHWAHEAQEHHAVVTAVTTGCSIIIELSERVDNYYQLCMSLIDLNYSQLEREVRELQKEIRIAEKGGEELYGSECSLIVKTEVLGTPRVVEFKDDEVEEEGEQELRKCVDIKVSFSSSSNGLIRDAVTAVSCPLPLTTHPSHLHHDTVTVTPSPHTITVVCTSQSLPVDRHITLSSTFTNNNGVKSVLTERVCLPLSLFCQPCMPAKTATHKVTLDTNRPAVSLHSLYRSLLPSSPKNAPPNAMGFKLLAGPEITIVASKSSERYRLQTESFPVLGIFLDDLIERLEQHFNSKGFHAGYSGSLPLNDYFELIDQHHSLRCDLAQCREVMCRQSLQFRAVQKRLLTRFKDKTPSGLSHLDTLLEGTYRQLMSLAEKSESIGLELIHMDHLLSCATKLINTLIRLTAGLKEEEYALLTATLSPLVYNSDTEQGWEETVDAAVTHSLRTSLAKSNKDQATGVLVTQETPLDSQKLKRHIALFCDRILKGAKLCTDHSSSSNENKDNTRAGNKDGGQTRPEQRQQIRVSRKHKPALPSLTEDTSQERHAEL